MSDDLEDFLRSEFAARAQNAPASVDGLAEAAMGGARRIRRRRRVAAGAGGVAALVFAAGAAAWSPLTALVDPEKPPVASDVTTEEAQHEFDVEFVAERQGEYGVINADDQFIPLPVSSEPTGVYRLAETYVVSAPGEVQVVSFDGASSLGYEVPTGPDYLTTRVSSDAEAFAVPYVDDMDMPQRQFYDLYPGEMAQEPEGPRVLDLDYSLDLADWNDDVVVLTADLFSTSGGASGGPYYFNEQNQLGLESVSAAGYEAAVLADITREGYVCISDLEPGAGEAGGEQCGQLSDPATDGILMDAAGGEADSVDFVEDAVARYWGTEEEPLFPADSEQWETLYDSEFHYFDPGSQWQIAFSTGDDEWTMVDRSGDEPVLRRLRPPEGALFPVESYT